MCGPLVLGQVASRLAAVPAASLCEAHRLRAGLLLPYHAGRLTTYAALGAAAGTAGLAFTHTLASWRALPLLLAATLLLAAATGRLPIARPGWNLRWTNRLTRRSAAGTYLFGLALGLLPCGLIYAALVGACALATPLWGAAGMLAFGLGTVPMLAIIGAAGQTRRTGARLARFAPWVLAANALVLLLAAAKEVVLF